MPKSRQLHEKSPRQNPRQEYRRHLSGIGKVVVDWLTKGRIHPDDLEQYGQRSSPDGARWLGGHIWAEWHRKIIAQGRHPTKRDLAAFLRGYAATAGGWLPEGMAEYLSDRMDPRQPEPVKQGGRPPRRSADYRRDVERDVATAVEVLRCMAFTGFPKLEPPVLEHSEDDAVTCAAQRTGRHPVDVYLAYRQYRFPAALRLLFDSAPASSQHPAKD